MQCRTPEILDRNDTTFSKQILTLYSEYKLGDTISHSSDFINIFEKSNLSAQKIVKSDTVLYESFGNCKLHLSKIPAQNIISSKTTTLIPKKRNPEESRASAIKSYTNSVENKKSEGDLCKIQNILSSAFCDESTSSYCEVSSDTLDNEVSKTANDSDYQKSLKRMDLSEKLIQFVEDMRLESKRTYAQLKSSNNPKSELVKKNSSVTTQMDILKNRSDNVEAILNSILLYKHYRPLKAINNISNTVIQSNHERKSFHSKRDNKSISLCARKHPIENIVHPSWKPAGTANIHSSISFKSLNQKKRLPHKTQDKEKNNSEIKNSKFLANKQKTLENRSININIKSSNNNDKCMINTHNVSKKIQCKSLDSKHCKYSVEANQKVRTEKEVSSCMIQYKPRKSANRHALSLKSLKQLLQYPEIKINFSSTSHTSLDEKYENNKLSTDPVEPNKTFDKNDKNCQHFELTSTSENRMQDTVRKFKSQGEIEIAKSKTDFQVLESHQENNQTQTYSSVISTKHTGTECIIDCREEEKRLNSYNTKNAAVMTDDAIKLIDDIQTQATQTLHHSPSNVSLFSDESISIKAEDTQSEKYRPLLMVPTVFESSSTSTTSSIETKKLPRVSIEKLSNNNFTVCEIDTYKQNVPLSTIKSKPNSMENEGAGGIRKQLGMSKKTNNTDIKKNRRYYYRIGCNRRRMRRHSINAVSYRSKIVGSLASEENNILENCEEQFPKKSSTNIRFSDGNSSRRSALNRIGSEEGEKDHENSQLEFELRQRIISQTISIFLIVSRVCLLPFVYLVMFCLILSYN